MRDIFQLRLSGVSLSTILLPLCQTFVDDTRDLICQKRWNGVADLGVLVRAIATEEVVIRKSLQASGFPDCQAPALRRIIMHIIVAVLCYVTDDCCRGI